MKEKGIFRSFETQDQDRPLPKALLRPRHFWGLGAVLWRKPARLVDCVDKTQVPHRRSAGWSRLVSS